MVTGDIQPTHLRLAKLFKRRLFYVPDYQRAYSWSKRERRDLFDDLEAVHSEGHDHFMATVVCLKREEVELGTDRYAKLDIVDGQQRLTTLIILLNAIRIAVELTDKDKKVAENLRDMLIKPEGKDLLLQTNHDSSHYFLNYLREGTAPAPAKAKTLADKELLLAIRECQSFVKDWAMQRGLKALAALIKNRLTFIFHQISDEKLVYTVFEVLNSRGLEVAWLDRLKSVLMWTAFSLKKGNHDELITELHTIWRDVYKTIGLRQGLNTEALRFTATLLLLTRPSKPLGERDAVDELRKIATDASGIRRVAHQVLKVTEACDSVLSNQRLNAVTQIVHARLLAVAIHLRSDITEKERDDLLQRWEKVTFRIYGLCGKDARTKVGDYVRLSWDVHQGAAVQYIHDRIKEIGADYPIEKAIDDMKGNDCYSNWKNELRYFMYRYEEHLAEEKGLDIGESKWKLIWGASAASSIEHISPQSPQSKTSVADKDRLGNLMLLPPRLNSRLNNRPPKEKVDAYRNSAGLFLATEVAAIIEEKGWSKKVRRAREETLLEWARDEWVD